MWPVTNRWEVQSDPFRELNRLHRQMNQLLDGSAARAEFPPVNIWGNGEQLRVAAELPGVDPDQIQLTVTGNTLTIEGERVREEAKEQEVVYRNERPAGRFARAIRLPYEVDAGAIAARYEQGVLKVTLPRSEATKPRRIAVQA